MKQLFFSLLCFFSFSLSAETIHLRDNLQAAEAGDYIVTARDKNLTLLRIREADKQQVAVDEVTIPVSRMKQMNQSWRSWFSNGAPYHTSWVTYTIELPSGSVKNVYSHTLNAYCQVPEDNNLFTKLLNLNFYVVPERERKRKGSTPNPARSPYWSPRLIVDGRIVPDAQFTPWKTKWPNDGSDLAGKNILIYLPNESKLYPNYFPYWMQFSGPIVKVQVRIVDSGKGLL